MVDAMRDSHQWPLFVDEQIGKLSVGDLVSRCHQIDRVSRRDYGAPLGLVVVDYLGLMDSPGENGTQRARELSRDLKQASKRLGVPILALHQLSRETSRRDGQKGRLSDLDFGGEQDADQVWLLSRKGAMEGADPNDPEIQSAAELELAKVRDGETFRVPLYWWGKTLTFSQLTTREAPSDWTPKNKTLF